MRGLAALQAFHLGFRYGNLIVTDAACDAMNREGMPGGEEFRAMARDIWGDIPAAQDGWAFNPTEQEE